MVVRRIVLEEFLTVGVAFKTSGAFGRPRTSLSASVIANAAVRNYDTCVAMSVEVHGPSVTKSVRGRSIEAKAACKRIKVFRDLIPLVFTPCYGVLTTSRVRTVRYRYDLLDAK